jgi:carbonic anhydrase/acetyltransferase-like protein (isoleucine patch superfamily)
MAFPPSVVTSAIGRGRHLAHRARYGARGFLPVARTALRNPADRRPPLPSEFARFGAGSHVVPPCRISGASGIEVGDGVLILEDSGLAVHAEAGARLVIGDRVRLAPGAEITCTVGITIGGGVSSSDYASISDTWASLDHPPGNPPPPPAPVVIGPGAYLGWCSFIGPGVTVGAGAFIGEGAIVLEDVAPHTVVYGNPARVVRRLDPATGAWEGERFP